MNVVQYKTGAEIKCVECWPTTTTYGDGLKFLH